MATLKAEIDHENTDPPKTVISALDRLTGSKQAPDPEKPRKLAEERHTVEQQNAMLKAKGCPQVDIDQAQVPATQKPAANVWNASIQNGFRYFRLPDD